MQSMPAVPLPSYPYLDWVDVLANAPHVLVYTLAPSIDLLWVDTISGMQVLHLAIGEDPGSRARSQDLDMNRNFCHQDLMQDLSSTNL